MKPKITLYLCILLLTTAFAAFKIDDDPLAALLKKLETYTNANLQEKVHLHLDKPYYAVGDDIWFKAYVIDTRDSKPSLLSGILYVELINERDSLKKQLKLPLMGGVTWGDFKLTDSLNEGNYRIRAYTQLMRNAGPEFFFDKTIKIGNSWANKVFTNTTYQFSKENTTDKVNATIKFTDKRGLPFIGNDVSYEVQLNSKTPAKSTFKGKGKTGNNGEIAFNFTNASQPEPLSGKVLAVITLPDKQKVTKTIPLKSTSATSDTQFFPEGGNLVENLPSKVAFKAVGADGLGVTVKGTVLDNEGTEITRFNSTYLGMGNFILNPQPEKTYTAVISYPDGSEQKVALPKAQPNGYVVSINNRDTSKVNVKILISPGLLSKGELRLVAQSNGNIYFVSKAKTEKQIVSATIPKKDLPAGIVQFTLFGPDNLPAAERLVFNDNPVVMMNTTVSSNKKTYAKRESADFTITSLANGLPTQGSFSVSVTNTSTVSPDLDNESNIYTSLLLTSDLAGYVEKPNHYFLNENPEADQELDNLMLTQGWRRFLWKNIIGNVPPVKTFEPEKYLKISGTITTEGGKPIPLGKVSLFSSSGGFFAIDTVTDVNGRFSFDDMIFNDSTKFVVQARTAKNKKWVEIKLDNTPGQFVTTNKNTGDVEINVNEALSAYIKKSESYFDELTRRGMLERTIQLKQVDIVQTKNQAPNSNNLNGAGNADAVIKADQLGTCVTLSQCLQGRVAGLIFQNGVPYLMRSMQTPMQVVVDGVNVESDFIDNINIQDIETIEVLKSIGYTAMYGSRGGGGVLIITTKRGGGNYSYNTYAPGIVTYAPKGYHQIRQFYSPKHTPGETDNRPDLRTTVYWNPHVVTDPTGKGTFTYFNTDLPGTYRVVVEGINSDGKLARNVYTYIVN
ncbi:TonB-dependent receptor plug domain-containing protein [Pedobacter sp. MC2016-14]|uniref:carboxypeptidase-like regulatory domain-containing protein n=1 Tax=Pedobacter sp. MC2016-14 TaxID=2897327 RepID=UPI001E4C01DB|nr:carboxypeptidase-like regulatory domain-containing protein [Pedobacter sp. MC2016-14]MCD0487026.1 TonB-dependent receptor plug domain-containing protein [Pedobacter sp. MC2016-14]